MIIYNLLTLSILLIGIPPQGETIFNIVVDLVNDFLKSHSARGSPRPPRSFSSNSRIPAGESSPITNSSGYLARRASDRLADISRFLTMSARNDQEPLGAPSTPWNPRREAYVHRITDIPSFQAMRTA